MLLPGHGGLDDTEAFLRRQLSDEGLAVWASRTDRRRCKRLRRLYERLKLDEALRVSLSDQDDGRRVLTVMGRDDLVAAFPWPVA